MINEADRSWIVKTLMICCVCCLVILIVGTFTQIVFQIHEQNIVDKYATISQNLFRYCIGYVFFSLLSLTIVPILVILAFFAVTRKRNSLFDILGIVFVIPYTILATIAYGSQYLVFPYLLDTIPFESPEILNSWFFTSHASIPYSLDLIGYAYLGISSLCIGYKFLFEKGNLKLIGILLYVTGVLSILAIIFHGLQYRNFGEVISMVSGGLTFLLIVLILVFSKRIILPQNSPR